VRDMEIAIQLSVFLDHKPGTLAKVCEQLAKEKINIYALTISDTSDHSVVRMVVSDPRRALEMFEERAVLVIENDVLMVENSNKPGSLAKIAERLGKAKINILYAYLATSPDAKSGLLIIRADDIKAALKILKKG
jgi:hypothetical protein